MNFNRGDIQMIDNYPKAYKEVLEVLKYVPQESVDKIPEEMRNMFKIKMDETWNFEVDINKPFEEQELLEETKAIFANIFRDYWATPYQKERIEAQEKYELEKIEEEKRKIYNPDDIFKKNKVQKDEEEPKEYENNLPVEVKKENFFKRLIRFITSFLKKKKY